MLLLIGIHTELQDFSCWFLLLKGISKNGGEITTQLFFFRGNISDMCTWCSVVSSLANVYSGSENSMCFFSARDLISV